jgi:hypothetical protein
MPASVMAELSARFDRTTEDLFFSGVRVKRALETLEDIREKIVSAHFSVATNPNARGLLRKVTLALIRGYQTANRSESAERLMKEFVVSFPDLPVQASIDGRSLADLYDRTSRSLLARGTISVRFTGTGAVYLNERRVEGPRINVPEGEYRVFVATSEGNSRLHRLTVAEGTVELVIDLPFEVALETDEFVGFRFRDAAERSRQESAFVGRLAKAISAREVVAISTAYIDTKEGIALSLYRQPFESPIATVMTPGLPGVVRGSEIAQATRRLVIERAALTGQAEVPTPDQDRAAGLLVISTRTIGAHAVSLSPPERRRADARAAASSEPLSPSSRPASQRRVAIPVLSWTLLAAGLAVAVAGAALIPWDGIGSCQSVDRLCPTVYDTQAMGAAVLSVGGAFAVTGTGLALGLSPSRRRMRIGGIVALSWGAAMILAGGLSFAVKDYPLTFYPNGSDVEKVTKSMVPGAAVMGVGGALAIVGTSLLIADRRHSRSKVSWQAGPIISSTAVGAMVSAAF